MFSVMLMALAVTAGVATVPIWAMDVVELTQLVLAVPSHQLELELFQIRVAVVPLVFCGPVTPVLASQVKVCETATLANSSSAEANSQSTEFDGVIGFA
jgi:hypothetical protein